MQNKALHQYTLFLSAAVFCLIIAGGLVTSTESGLSVPDWPLSYGQYFPPMVGGIRYEHTHRVIAGFVGILTLILTILIFKKDSRVWMKKLGVLASLAVVLQAVLGGLTVIYFLPRPVSVAHACLAQIFFSLIAALALFTSREWSQGKSIRSVESRSTRRLLVVTTSFIFLQLVVGAAVRHGQKNDPLLVYHYVLAFLIFIHAFFVLSKLSRDGAIQSVFYGHGVLLGGLVTLQVFLGFGAFIFTRMLESEQISATRVFFATAHHSLGALILAVSVVLTLRAFRLLKEGASNAS